MFSYSAYKEILWKTNKFSSFSTKYPTSKTKIKISPWKNNIFWSVFFYHGMDGYFRFRTSIWPDFASRGFVPRICVQTPWICTYRDLFVNGFISPSDISRLQSIDWKSMRITFLQQNSNQCQLALGGELPALVVQNHNKMIIIHFIKCCMRSQGSPPLW